MTLVHVELRGPGAGRKHRHRRRHVMNDQLERGAGLGAVAVGCGDDDGLGLVGSVVGGERPRPGAVGELGHGAHGGRERDRVAARIAPGAEGGRGIALVDIGPRRGDGSAGEDGHVGGAEHAVEDQDAIDRATGGLPAAGDGIVLEKREDIARGHGGARCRAAVDVLQDAVEVQARLAAGAVARQRQLELLARRDRARAGDARIELEARVGDVQAAVVGELLEVDQLVEGARQRIELHRHHDGVGAGVGQAAFQAHALVVAEAVAAAAEGAAVGRQGRAAQLVGQVAVQLVVVGRAQAQVATVTDAWGDIVDGQVERCADDRGAVAGGDDHRLRLGRAVAGEEGPRPSAVGVLRHRADRGRQRNAGPVPGAAVEHRLALVDRDGALVGADCQAARRTPAGEFGDVGAGQDAVVDGDAVHRAGRGFRAGGDVIVLEEGQHVRARHGHGRQPVGVDLLQGAVEVDARLAGLAVARQRQLEVLIGGDRVGAERAGEQFQLAAGDVQAVIAGALLEIEELVVVIQVSIHLQGHDDRVGVGVSQAAAQLQTFIGGEGVTAAAQGAAVRQEAGAPELVGQAAVQFVQVRGLQSHRRHQAVFQGFESQAGRGLPRSGRRAARRRVLAMQHGSVLCGAMDD